MQSKKWKDFQDNIEISQYTWLVCKEKEWLATLAKLEDYVNENKEKCLDRWSPLKEWYY